MLLSLSLCQAFTVARDWHKRFGKDTGCDAPRSVVPHTPKKARKGKRVAAGLETARTTG